jgi:hypothetical protein
MEYKENKKCKKKKNCGLKISKDLRDLAVDEKIMIITVY